MAFTGANLLGQGTDNTSNQTFSVTPTSSAGAGRLLIFGVCPEDGVSTAGTPVTDGVGNTWARADGGFLANGGGVEMFYTVQNAGTVTTSVSVTYDHGTTFVRPNNWFLIEAVGTPDSTPLDQHTSVLNTAASQAITAPGATSQADEIAIVLIDTVTGATIALDAALTQLGTAQSSASGSFGTHVTAIGYQILSATGTPSYTNVRTGGSRSMSVLATFKAGGGGGGGGVLVPATRELIVPSVAVVGSFY